MVTVISPLCGPSDGIAEAASDGASDITCSEAPALSSGEPLADDWQAATIRAAVMR
jgi:hypothetical protein